MNNITFQNNLKRAICVWVCVWVCEFVCECVCVSHLAAFSLGRTPLCISLAKSNNGVFFRCCLTTFVT